MALHRLRQGQSAVAQHAEDGLSDPVFPGEGGAFQHFGHGRRRPGASHPLDRLTEVIEESALNLVNQKGTKAGSPRRLFDNRDPSGLAHRGADQVVVDVAL
jgi:hypothetical protein